MNSHRSVSMSRKAKGHTNQQKYTRAQTYMAKVEDVFIVVRIKSECDGELAFTNPVAQWEEEARLIVV